ncbi:MAG: hypothetical protein IPI40_03345 [Betaproteobacteria bacterium]|nr:hypothetical protein [Betaproteobacteria bacterium]
MRHDFRPGKYLMAKVTKAKYAPAAAPIYLRRDEGVVSGESQSPAAVDDGLLTLLVLTLREEIAAGRCHSRNSFTQKFWR